MTSWAVNKWHTWMAMSKFDKAWHEQDLADEVAELNDETQFFKRWSELSDVVYTCTRGKWSGHNIPFPYGLGKFYFGLIYMIPKYSGRSLFYRRAGKKLEAKVEIREVRNPKKVNKLHIIAEKYCLDKLEFQAVCKDQLKHWLLLP